MKLKVFIFTLVVLFVASAAEAQSTLNFVRQFQPSELQTTGFAIANPSSVDAAVTYTLYSAAGVAIATSTQTVPAAGQYAKLGSELFPGVTTAGWVQATSAAPGLTGFWLSGDFSTFTDGAEAGVVAKTLVLPIATDKMDVTVVNPGTSANSVRIRLIAPDGSDAAATATQNIAIQGVYQASVSAIFPGANFAAGTYVLLSGDSNFSASSVVRGFLVPTETAVLNGVDGTTSAGSLFFPHVISGNIGGSNYTTIIGVTNLSTTAQSVTLIFNPEPAGAPLTVQRNLPASGSLRDTAQNIFGLPGGFQDGWVKVIASQTVTGFVAYGDTVAGGLAVVPPQPGPRSSMLFAHVAGLPAWYTGIALLNASDTAASIEITALNPAGVVIGSTAQINLAAKHKTARLLGDLVPEANAQNGGFVIVRSTVPLFGLQLFGGTNGKILSNIASGRPGPNTSTQVSIINTQALGRVAINNIEWDTTTPHACDTSAAGCLGAQPGTKILRIRFDLLDKDVATLSQQDALNIYLGVTLSGTNISPALSTSVIGGVQGPPNNIDSYIIATSVLNTALFQVPASPPYNTVYLGFVVPTNASAFKLAFGTAQVIDLGL